MVYYQGIFPFHVPLHESKLSLKCNSLTLVTRGISQRGQFFYRFVDNKTPFVLVLLEGSRKMAGSNCGVRYSQNLKNRQKKVSVCE